MEMYTNRYEVKEGNFNHSFICGALSGLVASFSIYPIDLMRTRFATRKYDNAKILVTLRNLVRKDGAIVLFNGVKGAYYNEFGNVQQLEPFATDSIKAQNLWKESEKMSGVVFKVL